jgi:hypothetical protein
MTSALAGYLLDAKKARRCVASWPVDERQRLVAVLKALLMEKNNSHLIWRIRIQTIQTIQVR